MLHSYVTDMAARVTPTIQIPIRLGLVKLGLVRLGQVGEIT